MMIMILNLLMSGFTAQANPLSTPVLVTRYMAKEYCSCRYVVKQSHDICKDENKTTSLVFSISDDPKNKKVQVSSLFEKAEARFLNKRYGCELIVKEKN